MQQKNLEDIKIGKFIEISSWVLHTSVIEAVSPIVPSQDLKGRIRCYYFSVFIKNGQKIEIVEGSHEKIEDIRKELISKMLDE
jgi:hypothetical protein